MCARHSSWLTVLQTQPRGAWGAERQRATRVSRKELGSCPCADRCASGLNTRLGRASWHTGVPSGCGSSARDLERHYGAPLRVASASRGQTQTCGWISQVLRPTALRGRRSGWSSVAKPEARSLGAPPRRTAPRARTEVVRDLCEQGPREISLSSWSSPFTLR